MSEPSIGEVHQYDVSGDAVINRPVAVVIEGPVRTQPLPSVIGASRVVVLPSDGTPVQVGNRSEQRKRMLLLAIDQPFYVGVDRGDVQSLVAGKWPINVVLEWLSVNPVWAASATGGSACTLTVVEDFWTD